VLDKPVLRVVLDPPAPGEARHDQPCDQPSIHALDVRIEQIAAASGP
jgi:hypothetical protein